MFLTSTSKQNKKDIDFNLAFKKKKKKKKFFFFFFLDRKENTLP